MKGEADRILVPVSRSRTFRLTVDHAVETALETASRDDPAGVLFVYVHPQRLEDGESDRFDRAEDAEALLQRAVVWAEEDAADRLDDLVIETQTLGSDEYLFSPGDIADVLIEAAEVNGINRIVIDPEYDPGIGAPLLRPLEYELAEAETVAVEEAPVVRPIRRTPLLRGTTPRRIAAVFGVAFLFYQTLSGTFAAFDLVTGAVSATIVAVAVARVSLDSDPTWRTPIRLLRLAVYAPYLLWEIIKANVIVAAVILHPRLEIDPRMTRVDAALWGPLPVTTLANSITLTPGTLTVRVRGRRLLVHSLVPAAREGLLDGGLERAVRFVFYGRRALRIASPRDRGEALVVDADASVDPTALDADGSPGDHS